MKHVTRFFFSLMMVLGFAAGGFAQGYVTGSSVGTQNSDFDYNTAGTDVLTITSQDVLSSWQSLPFAFDFYGSAVTGYYVSDNGYITFDQAATTSDPNNTAIPSAGGPNNAIYAFWDDVGVVSGSGSADRVTTWTYGTSPQRVHVIQWYSVTPVSGTGFLYATIRLYECGDFDILHTFGNATGMTATVGAENATGTMAAQITGSPNIAYPAVGSAPDDDIVVSFFNTGINYDLSVTTVDLNNFVTVGQNDVTGTIVNNGNTAITSFDLNYTINGGSAVTSTITANIAANGGTYAFTHPTQWDVTTGGQSYNLCVYADNLNGGQTDQRTCNDSNCKDLFSNNGTSGTHTVLLEEFTGAWCGWCPDGAVVQENITDTYPGQVVAVSIHDGDQMEFSDGIRSGFGVSAYPNGMVDRVVFAGEPDEPHSRGAWEANCVAQFGSYTPVDLDITGQSYDATSRQLSCEVTASFVDYAAGDIRIGLMIVEDHVTGTGTGYDQVNYLDGTSGHPYFGAGDPILGYDHRAVLRALPGGAYGVQGTIPATVNPSNDYNESFTYTLPAGYDETEISMIAFIGYYSTNVGERYLLDAVEVDMAITGVEDELAGSYLKVYPNPTSGAAMLKATFNTSVEGTVQLMNSYGQVVATVQEGSFFAGDNFINLDLSEYANGIYFLKVDTDKGALTQKVMIAR